MEQAYAVRDPRTAEFMKEFIALCQKHKLAILPSNDAGPDCHDSMIVVKLDKFFLNYYNETGVPIGKI